MYRRLEKNLLNSNISSKCPHNVVNLGPLTAEIGSVVWGIQQILTGFASWLRYCSDVAHRKPTKLHEIWPSPGLVDYMYIFGGSCPDRILPGAEFTLHPSLAFSYIGSVTARHSSSWVSQTLQHGTRNGTTELSHRAPPIFGRAAITLGIVPHSS